MYGNTKTQDAARPKRTSQGRSANTKMSATSRNSRKKRYRGQGK
ncbi:hypothetical protein Syn7803US7_105 [Synechococcus phage ACG-2014f]|uniref:Uncharacterized protein n=1 Tax=Synechococcus phage ACG-2014f TaxID=1493511 RepID=A0A0E3HU16_9CAUD|nr:hypothetical protein Syn7803US7_105 [Synechococcus phage ACG-2014f]